MQQGATLEWTPQTGYVLVMTNGETEQVRWYVAVAQRSAGTIVPNY